MTDQEAKRVQALSADMVPRCVGQHVLDIPRSFELNTEAYAEIDGVVVKVTPMQKADFEVRLKVRSAALASETLYGKPDKSLKVEMPLKDGKGVVFDRSEDQSSNVLRTLELWSWSEGFNIQMKTGARDMSFSRASDADDGRATTTPEKLALLLSVYNRIRGRAETEVPAEPGTCIANGFVSGALSDKQAVNVPYHVKGSIDAYLLLAFGTDRQGKTSLLERSANVEQEMKASGTQTIRKGKRDLAGLSFDEWLFKGATPNGVAGNLFALVANEKVASAQTPLVRAELFNGFTIPYPGDLSEQKKEELGLYKTLERSSLSEAEAVALWDKITSTLRPR
jgi:Tle cognate immunity protein 4 C-terminal domain/Tle cognate immunity protein 4 N-terminal domain